MAGVNAVITGWGYYVPPKVISNGDIAQMLVDARSEAQLPLGPKDATSDEWITKNTGIRERRMATGDEVTSAMGAKAARRALDRAGLAPRDVDAIVVATASPDYLFPSTACLIQAELGASRAAVFDIEAACTGFIYALAVARGFIVAGTARTILVIGAETLSRFVDYTDRGTCILFGDGAGAVVVEGSNASVGIASTILRGDGTKADLLKLPGGGARYPASKNGSENGLYYIKMEGPEVFKLAIRSMAQAAGQAIEEAGLRREDIDLIVPHQANKRIIDGVAESLFGRVYDPEKVFINIEKYGNTSAASIPIALCEAVEEGRVSRGDKLLLVAFGGGFTWGAAVVEWFGPVDAYRQKSLVGRLQRQFEEIVGR